MGFEILASDDFKVSKYGNSISLGTIQLLKKDEDQTFMSHQSAVYVIKRDITEVVELDEDTYRSALGTFGWGTLGFVLAGPVGAGLIGYFKGKKDDVICGVKFNDGKSAIIKVRNKDYRKLSANLKLESYKDTFPT